MEDRSYVDDSVEERVGSEEERYEESSSSSSLNFAIGKRLPGLVVPMVEGLIVSKKSREDGTTDISLILAPYIKKGVWVKAAISIKNSTKLSKRNVEKYRYPLQWGSKLTREAIRNKGDSEWIKMTIDDINAELKEGSKEREFIEEEIRDKKKGINDRRKSSSFRDSSNSRGAEKGGVLRSSRRRSSRIAVLRKWSLGSSDKERESSKKEAGRSRRNRVGKNCIWGGNPKIRRAARKITRSSSDSQDSNQKGDLEDKEVWDSDEEDDGIVYCPFTSKDIRRYIDVKESIKGRVVERRFIRQALHNLYRHFTSLQTFVDSIRSKSVSHAVQPFALDWVWLEHHAIYIDSLLFESLRGMWSDWNAPVLDLLVISFLELTVRCMPKRAYPDKLEKRVRRWMKKNQVGISSAYGPVPYFLQGAKVTERGVSWRNNTFPQYGRGRGFQAGMGRGEFRGRGNSSSSGFRRGGAKQDGKGGANE